MQPAPEVSLVKADGQQGFAIDICERLVDRYAGSAGSALWDRGAGGAGSQAPVGGCFRDLWCGTESAGQDGSVGSPRYRPRTRVAPYNRYGSCRKIKIANIARALAQTSDTRNPDRHAELVSASIERLALSHVEVPTALCANRDSALKEKWTLK